MAYTNQQKRILLVMSSNDEIGISGKQTGTWFHELAAPYYIFTDAGDEVVFVSPKGGEAPIGLLGMKSPFTTEYTERFRSDPVALKTLRPRSISFGFGLMLTTLGQAQQGAPSGTVLSNRTGD